MHVTYTDNGTAEHVTYTFVNTYAGFVISTFKANSRIFRVFYHRRLVLHPPHPPLPNKNLYDQTLPQTLNPLPPKSSQSMPTSTRSPPPHNSSPKQQQNRNENNNKALPQKKKKKKKTTTKCNQTNPPPPKKNPPPPPTHPHTPTENTDLSLTFSLGPLLLVCRVLAAAVLVVRGGGGLLALPQHALVAAAGASVHLVPPAAGLRVHLRADRAAVVAATRPRPCTCVR